MNTLPKHYYLAISYYYITNNFDAAREECLQALDFAPKNVEVNALLKIVATKDSSPSAFDHYRGEIFREILDKDNIDLYLAFFISEHGFHLPKNIHWEHLIENFVPNSPQHRVWLLILKNDWERAYSLGTTLLPSIQGNPIVYFQLGCLFLMQKQFMEAENYFFLLAKFGVTYSVVALSMLLKLPQHNYTTLAKSECIKSYSLFFKQRKEIFVAGDILQKSWDEKAFATYAKYVFKNSLSTFEYLNLAELHINNGDWNNAIKCCYQLKKNNQSDIEAIVRLFLEIPLVSFPHQLQKFFSWFVSSVAKEDLLFLGKKLQKPFPKIALRCFAKMSKDNLAESILGQAICYYHLKKYKRSKERLQKLKAFPDYLDNALQWEYLIDVEAYPQKTLTNAYQCYQERKTAVLATTIKDISSVVCPHCQKYKQNKSVCENCDYPLYGNFFWKDKSLHWNPQELFFPIHFFLITTDALLYTEQEDIFIIVFSPCPLSFYLDIKKDNQPFSSENIEIKGLHVISKKNFLPGVYSVELSAKNISVRQHFVVCKQSSQVEIKCIQQNWNKAILETSLAVTDRWSDSISWENIVLYDFTLNRKYNAKKIETKDSLIHCIWNVPQEASSSLYILVTVNSNVYAAGIKTRETKTWKEIQTLFLSNLAKTNIPYKNKKEYLKLNIPFSTSEVTVITQPFGNDPIDIHRYQNIVEGDPVRTFHPLFISGAYLGVTRFTDENVQDIAVDLPFLLIHRPQRLDISYPEHIEPGEKFTITIKSPIQAKLFVFSRHKRIFNPLKDQLYEWGEETLRLRTPNKNITHDIWPITLHTKSFYKRFLGTFDIDQEAKIDVVAIAEEGVQKFTFLVSDENYFIEKTISIDVSFNKKIDAFIPNAIGEKSCITVPISLSSIEDATFTIQSNKRGMLAEGKTKLFQDQIEIYEPDVISIVLGEKNKKFTIESLHTATICKSIVEKIAGDYVDQKNNIFSDTFQLIHALGKNLLRYRNQNIEKITADLYVLATLYDFSVHKKLEVNSVELENKIHVLEKKLLEHIQHFGSGLWACYAKALPDEKICAEILCHLAIFSELPKFNVIHDKMKLLWQVCLDANIKDNRLLGLSLDFQEKISSPESAAGLILHDIEVDKAIKYLHKHAKKTSNGSVYWESKNLGGNEAATAWVTNALIKKDHYLAEDALKFLNTNIQKGTLSNSIATTSYIRTLKRLASKQGKITWQKTDYNEKVSLLDNATQQKFAMLLSTELIYKGRYFTITAKIKKVKYPKITLLIPPHILVFDPLDKENILQNQESWSSQDYSINIHCKALLQGTGYFYIIVEEAYNSSSKFVDSIQITTLGSSIVC